MRGNHISWLTAAHSTTGTDSSDRLKVIDRHKNKYICMQNIVYNATENAEEVRKHAYVRSIDTKYDMYNM